MLTRQQADSQIVDRITDQFATWKDGACKERALRARVHLLAGDVQPTDTAGVWRVRSTSNPEHWYTVNGTCQCVDATTKAPFGACKHRIAAKMATKRLEGLMDLVARKVVHQHQYTCGHAVGHVECWQEGCEETVILCPGCAREEAEVPEDVGEAEDRWEVEDQEDAESRPAVPVIEIPLRRQSAEGPYTSAADHWYAGDGLCEVGCPGCAAELAAKEAEELSPLTYHEAETGYEANPQTVQHTWDCPAADGGACVCVPGILHNPHYCVHCGLGNILDLAEHECQEATDLEDVVQRLETLQGALRDTQPMPEAPASLNFKFKKGQSEIMWTMRSMVPGAGGDAELAQRLPLVLEALKRAGLLE